MRRVRCTSTNMAARPSRKRKSAPVEHAVSDSCDAATEHCGGYTKMTARPSRKPKSVLVDDTVSDFRDAATEHIAYDSCGAATERASIKIAGYTVGRRRPGLAPKTLLWLKYEIEHARHIPVTLAVLEDVGQNPKLRQRRSWSGTLEGVAHCTAAYHNAFVAGEPDDCNDCVDRLCRHACALFGRIENKWDKAFAIGLVYDYIENRATDLAAKQILGDALCRWDHMPERDRQCCIEILEDIKDQGIVQGNVLKGDLRTLNPHSTYSTVDFV